MVHQTRPLTRVQQYSHCRRRQTQGSLYHCNRTIRTPSHVLWNVQLSKHHDEVYECRLCQTNSRRMVEDLHWWSTHHGIRQGTISWKNQNCLGNSRKGGHLLQGREVPIRCTRSRVLQNDHLGKYHCHGLSQGSRDPRLAHSNQPQTIERIPGIH